MTKKKKTIVDRTLLTLRRLFPAASPVVANLGLPLRKARKEFVGKSINGHDGGFVGKVVDLMADLAGGRITYAVVSLNGLGVPSGSYSVLPWGVLLRAPLNDHVLSTAPAKQLRKAPRFPEETWPAMDDSTWCALVYRRCDKRPYWYFTDPVGPPVVLRVDTLLGMGVRNGDGEALGDIHELVLETSEGRIVYAVLSSSDSAGLGKKLSAIRCERLRLAPDRSSLRLDVSREALLASTGFDPDSWPHEANDSWIDGTTKRTDRGGRGARVNEGLSLSLVRASVLLGRLVDDRQGSKIGSIDELVIDLDAGRIATAILAVGGPLRPEERLVAVPAAALSIRGSDPRVVLDVDRHEVDGATGIARGAGPDVCDREWIAAAYDHFGFTPYWEGDLPSGPGRPG